ncbi:MAG: hypothetical protein ACKON8_05550 [Planctomycetota bacterium]
MTGTPSRIPAEPPDVLQSAEAEIRDASVEERGRMVARAVRAAAIIDRSRRESGLPEPVVEAWPASTREFLRRHAAAFRAASTGVNR